MPVPAPPRIPEALDTIDNLARALLAYQQWSTQLYNGVRPAVLRMERIAAVAPYPDPISDPPTKAQVEAVQARVNLIIEAANAEISGQ